MAKSPNKPGRPEKLTGKRTKIIKAKLTEDEFNQLLIIEKTLGINRMELIRTRVLHQSQKVLVNSSTLLKQLDQLGGEMGRSGNNINQLARHANVLHNHGLLTESVVIEFNKLFQDYIRIRGDTEKTLGQIIRLIKG
ncbi:plasmid mobilization protein [Mucilaginibacter sp.]|uniref:plasmid mobilization protein n=1 Tax=Mucilaginibacter sp. TaxID=1882438 RepID=UPI003D10C475